MESDSDQSSNVPEDFNSEDDEHFDSNRSNIEENEDKESDQQDLCEESDDKVSVDGLNDASGGGAFPIVSHFFECFFFEIRLVAYKYHSISSDYFCNFL